MTYFIVAGEASGDLHGAKLVQALKVADYQAVVTGWGGDMMAASGMSLKKHYRELAFMGFWEVVKNLRTILRNFRQCEKEILAAKPDALILIDYPGFNLRLAKWAKKQGIRVFYYISPQLWAWHTSRVKIIRECVERMFVVFPFEKNFYSLHGVTVNFVGHPLLDVIENQVISNHNEASSAKLLIALLPGSRRQEISRMLPVMLETSRRFPDYEFAVAGAPSMESAFYQPFLSNFPNVSLWENRTYELLRKSQAALVTSGTATLETALFNVPQVVCYKGNPLSFWLAKRLVNKHLKYIAMVNIVCGKPVVEELLQENATPENLSQAFRRLLDPVNRQRILADYQELRNSLGSPGAALRTAKAIAEAVSRSSPSTTTPA